MMRWVLLGSCVLALACSSKDESKAPATKPTAPVTKPPVAPPPPARTNTTESVKSHMKGHFTAILGIQTAVVHGQLATAKRIAATLAEHQPHGDIAWKQELKSVTATAKRLAEVTELSQATPLAAQLAGDCGSCHATMTTITSFKWSPVPDDKPDVRQRMQRHRWAIQRLWEGLVGPSSTSWTEGAEVLAGDALPAAKLVRDKASIPQVDKLAKQLQALAKQALTSDEPSARTKVYGELLGTCAGCHSLTRKPTR